MKRGKKIADMKIYIAANLSVIHDGNKLEENFLMITSSIMIAAMAQLGQKTDQIDMYDD